jgi:hypothetical protein
MKVEKLTAIAMFGNRGHKPDLVTDLWLVGKPLQEMRRVFEQKRHTTATDGSSSRTYQIHDFGGPGNGSGTPVLSGT